MSVDRRPIVVLWLWWATFESTRRIGYGVDHAIEVAEYAVDDYRAFARP